MSRGASRAGSLLVSAFAMALAGTWLVGGTGVLENRAPAAFPRIGLGQVLDRGAYASVDAALRDRLRVRGPVVTGLARAGYDGAGVSLSRRVWAGDDRELFVTDDFVDPCRPLDVAGLGADLDTLASAAGGAPGVVTLAFVPDKSTVLRERLGAQADQLMACSDDAYARERRFAAQRPDVVLDTVTPVVDLHRSDPALELFTPVDTHWTPAAAQTFSRALVERLAAATGAGEVRWQAPVPGPPRRYRDLLDLVGIHSAASTFRPALVTQRPGATTTSVDLPLADGRPARTYTTSGAPVVPGRTLVVYDSFVAEQGFGNDFALPMLAPYFERVTFVHWQELPSYLLTHPRVDRLVVDTVQRSAGDQRHRLRTSPAAWDALVAALRP